MECNCVCYTTTVSIWDSIFWFLFQGKKICTTSYIIHIVTMRSVCKSVLSVNPICPKQMAKFCKEKSITCVFIQTGVVAQWLATPNAEMTDFVKNLKFFRRQP